MPLRLLPTSWSSARAPSRACSRRKGFRDVLLIQRQLRVNIYDLFLDKVQPLLSRRFIREVDERMTHSGEIWKALDEDSVVEAVERLSALGVESFAVALLHSYANPAHERRVRRDHPRYNPFGAGYFVQ